MIKVVFFGLGAVGSVMASCLYELCEKDNDEIKFVFIVRNKEKAKQYLLRAPHVLRKSEFLVVKDFKLIFQNPKDYAKRLNNSSIFINTSTPKFNIQILKLATEFKACYADMASEYTSKKTRFSQENFHDKLKKSNLFGLINNGVSPGLTNFLVGEKLKNLKQLKILKNVKAINLYLLENIESEQIVFSWSPEVALEELESKPIYIQNNKWVMVEPFSHSLIYEFPHFRVPVMQYPINQEEVISLHKSFPQVKSIKISTGGSEIQLIKSLFQLNLLSKKNIECVKNNMSVEQIVRMVLPKLQSPKKIESMLKSNIIKSAQFSAMAEISLKLKNPRGKQANVTESIGVSFHKYKQLLGTPYSGATYISYPTGISAAILLFYTFKSWLRNKEKVKGIIKTEELPFLLEEESTEKIKQKLSSYALDFISHTDSFLKEKNEIRGENPL